MAFAAEIEGLTGDLIKALSQSRATTDKSFLRTRDAALRAFKTNKFLRTNHFEVEKSLCGLEEKFRVHNRDALANELKARLDLLSHLGFKWYPEALHLLLELSDQPTYNTKLEDIPRISADDDGGPKLRWEDIAQEDGWAQDSDIWDSINYSEGSGDEIFEDHPDEESDESSHFGGDAPSGRTVQDLIIHPQDNDALEAVIKQQKWKQEEPTQDLSGKVRKIGLSETQALREVLFMLHGLPTTLYDADGAPDPAFQIFNIAWQTQKSLLTAFSEAGGYINILRRFAAQVEKEPQLQALQDCVAKRVRVLDDHLVRIQERLASPTDQVVVSLIAAREELTPVLEPLFRLSGVILKVQQNPTSDNFRYLELLFDESSMAQLTGNQELYEFLARIFLECFTVYLREIRSWVQEGRLLPSDETFFIYNGEKDVPLGGIWQHRFKLRRTEDGQLLAPIFVHLAADKIYTTGKSIVILRLLGRLKVEDTLRSDQDQILTYESICPPGFESAPFPDLFNLALGQWIDRTYTTVSSALKTALFDDYGFEAALHALHSVYLMEDGAAASAFCERLFAKLDTKDATWQNRRVLTTSAQEAFAGTVDASRLSISVDAAADARHVSATEARNSVTAALPLVQVAYRPEWPVQMILDEPSAAHYQSVFTFSLQIKRAAHALHAAKLRDDLSFEMDAFDDGAQSEARGLFYAARSSLVWFVNTLQTYLVTVVLVPQTARMQRELRAAADVDGMMAAHARCAKHMTDQLCLGAKLAPLRAALLEVLDLGLRLAHARAENGVARMDQDGDDVMGGAGDSYVIVLRQIQADFARLVRFICGALRSVARAVSDEYAVRWDVLADMLQPGHGEDM